MKPERMESAIDALAKSKRPIVRRAISMEHRSSTPPATLTDVGSQPPRISDLIPPPSSSRAIARGTAGSTTGTGDRTGATFTTHVAEGPNVSQSSGHEDDQSHVPDFAPGRGGDGTGGAGRPTGDGKDHVAEAQARVERQKQTLGKLRRILAWYVVV